MKELVHSALLGRHLLVVEDAPGLQQVFTAWAARRGVHAVVVDDATRALGYLEAERPDLVITDVDLPGLSGLWLLRNAKARWPAVPVLLMSGSIRSEGERAQIEREADGFLLKPFSLDDLEQRIARLLAPAPG